MSMRNKRVLIIGTGAIGSFYGAILHKAGCNVSVVMRSDAEVVKQKGFQFTSPLGDISWSPEAVYSQEEATAAPTFDLVLLCVKVVPSIDRVALLAPWVSEQTTIMLIQNGIAIEAPIRAAFPENPLISALAFIAVSRVAPGQIEHKAYGRLVIGAYGEASLMEELAEAFVSGGIAVKVADNIEYERWMKCVWNTPFNPTSVLAQGADTWQMLDAPGGEALIRAMMMEVVEVAAAQGHQLPEGVVEQNIQATRGMPAYRNSMALDYLANRELELDAILGNVITIAAEHQVAVPHLATLWGMLQMRFAPSQIV